MARGGSRPNGGRKVGTLNGTTRQMAVSAFKTAGLLPIEVMAKNMTFWFHEAEKIGKELQKLIVDIEDPEDRREFIAMVNRFMDFRQRAQECAVDAAPYVHPRFAAIEFMNEDSIDAHRKALEEASAAGKSVKEMAEGYAGLVSPPA